MKELHSFFIDNDISYSLAWGSLIGAVRENGFVPWDDDIDIMMDRANYTKFLACCDGLENYEVKKALWVNRVQRKGEKLGIWHVPIIDIFVIDNIPDKEILFKFKVWILMALQGMLKKKPKDKSVKSFNHIVALVLYYFGKLFSVEFKQNLYEKVSKLGDKKDTLYVGCFNTTFGTVHIRYKSDLLENIELHSFEDTSLCIVSDYDSYLTSIYGDYMTPPEESKRRPQHLQ